MCKEREEDILKLVLGVLGMSPNTTRDHHDWGFSVYPFCYCEKLDDDFKLDMRDLKHEQTCIYLIAKDLATGL